MMYLRLEPGSELKPYDGSRPFRAVVVVEEAVSAEWQYAVSRWLIESDCLFMLAWGRECSSWDDSVDLANLEVFDFGEIPSRHDVMTTWHEDESLSKVFDFAKRHARSMCKEAEIEETVILHVSRVDRRREYSELFEAA